MTADLRCRACGGRGTQWGTKMPGRPSEPCEPCGATGHLDAARVALEVARAHGTRVAAETTGLSTHAVLELRHRHDDYYRGPGRPSRAELARESPRNDCSCIHCIDHRAREASTLTMLIAKLNVDRPALGGTWRHDAACAEADPEIFFPERGASLQEALAYCRRCPVREQCLEAGMQEHHGIWGGLSERGRRPLRSRRRKVAHGTRSKYVAGCRCEDCSEADRAYKRGRAS